MLLMNLGKFKNPVQIAKGVDPHRTDVKPAEPRFNGPQPFNDYTNLMHQDESLMGYNQFGQFTASEMEEESNRFNIMHMNENMSIINMMNQKRRGEI